MFKKAIFLSLLLAGFLGLTVSIPLDAYAYTEKEDIFTRFKKPLPEIPLLSEEDFYKATMAINKKPYSQKVLEYGIRLPKNWTEREDKSSSNFSLSKKLFLELNVYYGKPTIAGRSRVEVQALDLDSNLTAEQWYLRYILEGGYTLESFVTHSDNKVESLMVTMEKDYSFYVRTLVMFNGDKAIMVKYFVPIHYIQEQAAMQAQVLQSFSLKNTVERTDIETKSYRFLDVAELRYPESWKVYSKPLRSVDRIDITIVNVNEIAGQFAESSTSITNGKLEVKLVAAAVQDSLINEIKVYKQKVESSGILIGDKISAGGDISYNNRMNFAITEVYLGIDSTNSLSEYEYWFTVMVGGNYYYFLNLLTPSRNENFAVWADNTQSYKNIVESFRLMSGAFMERDY